MEEFLKNWNNINSAEKMYIALLNIVSKKKLCCIANY